MPAVVTRPPACPTVTDMPTAVAYALAAAPFVALATGLFRLTRA